ncbi:hypothetical protein Bca52824_045861 [Brassica carinata]|uniref:F-box/kelch-repeat protein n=1 Tax=Brassica carinata TaxID=52824 RepID=A0A8X7REH4_BRACI|nr:hypothetical protein Bca52824_045861 [Brassica carinata]
MVGIKPHIPDLNVKPCSDSDEEEKGEIAKEFQNLAGLRTHDVCYVDHKLLYELEVEIIARLPCFEYWKLQFLNKKFLQLLKSCEIFRDFKTFRRLPKVPSSDYCFFHSDKETISVGTQLIVIGREIDGNVVFRYELENHKWFIGPSMITPRAMYGSASHETSLNELRVYDINTNIWKKLGVVPVSANAAFGMGIAFKSMGDRLLVIGTSHSWHRKTVVHSCRPSPDVEEQHWEEIKHWCVGAELPQFIHNCCVMFA